MVKHVILWQLKDGLTAVEAAEVKRNIKDGLEHLKGVIPGLIDIKVITEGLTGSSADLMLDSSFEDVNALRGYAVHPEHVAVAEGRVVPNVSVRLCMDYEV